MTNNGLNVGDLAKLVHDFITPMLDYTLYAGTIVFILDRYQIAQNRWHYTVLANGLKRSFFSEHLEPL